MMTFLLFLGFCLIGAVWLSFYPDREVGDRWSMRFTFFLALLASTIGGAMMMGELLASIPALGGIFKNAFGQEPWWTYLPILVIGLSAWAMYRRQALLKQIIPGH